MALDKCTDCGNEISSSAKTCPQCGANLRSQRLKKPEIKSSVIQFVICEAIILLSFGGTIVGFLIYTASNRRMWSGAERIQQDHTIGIAVIAVSTLVFVIGFIIERKLSKQLKEYGIR